MSRSISKTDHLELVEADNGRLNWWLIEDDQKTGRIKESEVLKSFGHTTVKQKPVKGFWLLNGSVLPVTITGVHTGLFEGNQLYKSKEHIAIPKDQVKWKSSDLPPSENDEINALRTELESVKQESEESIANLENKLQKALGEIATLQVLNEENERLEKLNISLSAENERISRELAIERGEIPLVEPSEDAIQEQEHVESEELENQEPIDRVDGSVEIQDRETANSTTAPEGDVVIEDNRNWFSRTWDKIRAPAYARFNDVATRKVVLYDENDNVIREEPYDDRRGKLAYFLGGAALVGLLWWLYGRHGHDTSVIEHNNTLIEQNNDLVQANHTQLTELNHNFDVFRHWEKVRDHREINLLHRLLRIEHAEHHGKFREFFGGLGLGRGSGHGPIGEVFNVEHGNGLTNEIQDFSVAHGYGPVSGGRAWNIYQSMRAHLGTDLINSIGKSPDTYIRAQGDVGISNPGPAVWPRDVEVFLRRQL